jgi:hypothetical protein
VNSNERDRLEKPVRYMVPEHTKYATKCPWGTGPAIAEDRISVLPNGDVKLELKTPWRDGSEFLLFTPTGFRRGRRQSLLQNYPDCLELVSSPTRIRVGRMMVIQPPKQHSGKPSRKSGSKKTRKIEAGICNGHAASLSSFSRARKTEHLGRNL